MDVEQLKNMFFKLVSPELPNEWDVEEAVESLVSLREQEISAVFAQLPVIWPISNSLCFSYLTLVKAALQCIGPDLLGKWVNETLDQYEKSGLKVAQQFMQDIQGHFVCRLQGNSGLRFSEVEGRLLPYIRGLAKTNINLAQADIAGTDTVTVYLPQEIRVCADNSNNFLLYKLIASFQWGFLVLQTSLLCNDKEDTHLINPSPAGRLWLQDYFSQFANVRLIAALYFGLETLRVRIFLDQELPGLMRDARPLFAQLENSVAQSGVFAQFFNVLHKIILDINSGTNIFFPYLSPIIKSGASAAESLAAAEKIYVDFAGDTAEFFEPVPLLFQGAIPLKQIATACLKRRNEQHKLFVESLATLLLTLPQVPEKTDTDIAKIRQDGHRQPLPVKDPQVIIMSSRRQQSEEDNVTDSIRFITVDNQQVELSEELADLAKEISRDLGGIPDNYIASAAGKAGQGSSGMAQVAQDTGQPLTAPVTYDEWDYRRSGFRRNWCIITEKEIPVSKSTFMENTLASYHGQIIRLRHQFEMMRTRERFVRRQRDGDDIDLDALVESLADTVAGQPPSDRLFIRLQRDERDIAALFLVDMSNSTRGWVGQAIKEAIVLISEAMESLGDRYAIYGFSGMRRLRCEVFPIKHFHQLYDDEVRDKIGSIAPREYTRMAPAIRHATTILNEEDAKVRLLITLSDGKPEDYDDYKGEYAIEDTRHALIEAKMAGVHPFCITIDQHAHEYMARMYGEVNYIFIDDVRKLPVRMPEIYRVLTS